MSAQLTKGDLINLVAKDTGYSREVSKAIINSFCDMMSEAVGNGNSVSLNGFGGFYPELGKGRAFRIPTCDELIHASNTVKLRFKPGRIMRQRLHEWRDRVTDGDEDYTYPILQTQKYEIKRPWKDEANQ